MNKVSEAAIFREHPWDLRAALQKFMERSMAAAATSEPGQRGAQATAEDVRNIIGDVDDPKVLEILDLEPTIIELEEAVASMAGDADILEKEGHQLSAVAYQIVEILTAGEEEPR